MAEASGSGEPVNPDDGQHLEEPGQDNASKSDHVPADENRRPRSRSVPARRYAISPPRITWDFGRDWTGTDVPVLPLERPNICRKSSASRSTRNSSAVAVVNQSRINPFTARTPEAGIPTYSGSPGPSNAAAAQSSASSSSVSTSSDERNHQPAASNPCASQPNPLPTEAPPTEIPPASKEGSAQASAVVGPITIAVPPHLEPKWLQMAKSPTLPPDRNLAQVATYVSNGQFRRGHMLGIGDSLETHFVEDPSVKEPTDGSVLTLEIIVQLSCSHKLKIICDPNFEFNSKLELYCVAPCDRGHPCGHPCRKMCYEECQQCQKTFSKKYLCGHEAVIPCIDVGTSKDVCQVMALSKVQSSCPHPVLVRCGFESAFSPNEVAQRCTAPCGMEFSKEENCCAHICPGSCVMCRQGRFHVRCTQTCGRTLLCSHVCTTECSKHCPPCKADCEVKCEHGACQQKCGVPCKACQESCTWECPHQKCTKKCSELCDREPCNEACPETLPCGHPCISFCGEPCPTLCVVCDKESLEPSLIYSKDEVEKTDRFILLEDCGHAIEHEVLDQWMNTSSSDGEIYPKVCPLCQKPIYRCRRFNAILHPIRQDMEKVKRMVYGDKMEILNGESELFHIYKFGSDLAAIRCTEMCKYLQEILLTNPMTDENTYPNRFNLGEIRSLVHIGTIWLDIELKLDELTLSMPERYVEALSACYNRVLAEVIDLEHPLRALEIRDFHRQLDRFFDLTQLYRRRSFDFETNPGVALLARTPLTRQAFEKALQLAWLWAPYDDDLRSQFRLALAELDKLLDCKLSLTDKERKSILGALRLSSGRWFKCGNGHIYLITECGGAMENASCYECGLPIGGMNHRVTEGNRLATEMDGAIYPRYPGGDGGHQNPNNDE